MKYKGISIESISVFTTPGIYFDLAILLIIDVALWLKNFILKRGVSLLAVTVVWLLISNL
jgi:hypothetical protein